MKYHSIKPAKQQAASLRPGQFRHVLRVAAVTGRMHERDVMLLWVTHSTGIRVTELALLEIRDIMHPSGQLRDEVYLRGAITKHAHPRVIYMSPPKQWPLWRPGCPTGSNGAGCWTVMATIAGFVPMSAWC